MEANCNGIGGEDGGLQLSRVGHKSSISCPEKDNGGVKRQDTYFIQPVAGSLPPPPVSPTPIACVYLTQHSLLIGKWRHKNQSDLPKNGFQEPSRQLISERGVGRGSAGRQVTGAAWEGQRREDLPVQTPWSGRRY